MSVYLLFLQWQWLWEYGFWRAGGRVTSMGIIERLATVWWVSFAGLVVFAVAWRYFGHPTLHIFPPDLDMGQNRPQGLEFTAQNFGTYEEINIEQNVNGQWVLINTTSIRANMWGFAQYRSPAMVVPNQPGFLEYRAVGLQTAKTAYARVPIVDPFP
jgi:hypothetical protein